MARNIVAAQKDEVVECVRTMMASFANYQELAHDDFTAQDDLGMAQMEFEQNAETVEHALRKLDEDIRDFG